MIEEDRLIGGENQSNEDLKATSVDLILSQITLDKKTSNHK